MIFHLETEGSFIESAIKHRENHICFQCDAIICASFVKESIPRIFLGWMDAAFDIGIMHFSLTGLRILCSIIHPVIAHLGTL